MSLDAFIEFSPEDIKTLQSAYSSSCEALSFAIDYNADKESVKKIRNEVARALISAFRSGERSHARLVERALARLPPLKASWDAKPPDQPSLG